jgi:hypothetical protein
MDRQSAGRRRSFIIRLSDHEREMLQVVAAHEQLTASETVRLLVRLALEKLVPRSAAKPKKKAAKPKPKKKKRR